MTWFEELTGCREESPEQVRRQLSCDGGWLKSRVNGKSWLHGELEAVSLGQLRKRVRQVSEKREPIRVSEVVANVQDLHREVENRHSLFQVASQFNLLEMTSPGVTPECGVGIYEEDYTQGPACAIAAGAGTIFRNYFAIVNGRTGQTADNQIDCLAGVGERLGNDVNEYWRMVNGYALPSSQGLSEINRILESSAVEFRDGLRQALQVGIQWDAQVTLESATHTVSQVYCSAMPVAYTRHASSTWAPLATLVLEAAYEATLCAGVLNKSKTGVGRVFLTLLGGGAFGNAPAWILESMCRAIELHAESGLEISIVSYGSSNPVVRRIVDKYES